MIIGYNKSTREIENVDTFSWINRLRAKFIRYLIGDWIVMGNVKFNFITPAPYQYDINNSAPTLIFNTKFPDTHGNTVAIGNNTKESID
jgi:hypothetical protein